MFQTKRERKTREVTVLYENLEIKQVQSPNLLLQEGGLSNQNPEDKAKKVELSAKLYSDEEIGFVRLDFFNPHCNLQSVQTFSFSHMVYPWLSKLNEDHVEKALETILTLLAQQVGSFLLHFVDNEMGKFHIRRELCSELQIFHDYVKKCLVEQYKFDGQENNLFLRRKVEKKMEKVVKKVNKDIKRIPAESEDDTSYGSYGTNGSSIGSIDTDAILKHNEAEIAKARGTPRSEPKDEKDKKEPITDVSTPVGKTLPKGIVREIFKSNRTTLVSKSIENKELEIVKSDITENKSESPKAKSELSKKLHLDPVLPPSTRVLPPLSQMPQESLLFMDKETNSTGISKMKRTDDDFTETDPRSDLITIDKLKKSYSKLIGENDEPKESTIKHKDSLQILHKKKEQSAEDPNQQTSPKLFSSTIKRSFGKTDVANTPSDAELADDSDDEFSSTKLKHKDSVLCIKSKNIKHAHKKHTDSERTQETNPARVLYVNPKSKETTEKQYSSSIIYFDPDQDSRPLVKPCRSAEKLISKSEDISNRRRATEEYSTKWDDDTIEQIEVECPKSPLNWVYTESYISADDDPQFFDKALQEKMENELPDSESEEELSDTSTMTLETSPPSQTTSETSIATIPNSVPIDYIHFLSLWFDFALKTHSL